LWLGLGWYRCVEGYSVTFFATEGRISTSFNIEASITPDNQADVDDMVF
jgi:hypothetical protein